MKKTNSASKDKIVSKSEKFDNTKYWVDTGIDVEQRRVTLEQEIDQYSVGRITRAIRRMIDVNKEAPIDLYINSEGGCCYSGLKLYDFLRACTDINIRTHAEGMVMSMGLIVFLAGDERYSSPNSRFMAHTVSGGTDGKEFEVVIDTEEITKLKNINLDILRDRTKKSRPWWLKQIEYKDKYYSKKEALKLGIVTDKEFSIE